MTDKWIGKELPEVELESSEGGRVKLPADIKGRWTVLYFYPKDDTPGCTRQACSYRDGIEDFRKQGAQIIGVSMDDLHSHSAFIRKYQLNFPLLADTEHRLSEALGVYGEQRRPDRTYMGLSRDTFLIDPEGKIREVWRKVSPDTTLEETLSAVKKYL